MTDYTKQKNSSLKVQSNSKPNWVPIKTTNKSLTCQLNWRPPTCTSLNDRLDQSLPIKRVPRKRETLVLTRALTLSAVNKIWICSTKYLTNGQDFNLMIKTIQCSSRSMDTPLLLILTLKMKILFKEGLEPAISSV